MNGLTDVVLPFHINDINTKAIKIWNGRQKNKQKGVTIEKNAFSFHKKHYRIFWNDPNVF